MSHKDVVDYWVIYLLAEDGFSLWLSHFDMDFIFLDWLCGDSNRTGRKAEANRLGGMHHFCFALSLCFYFQCLKFDDFVFELFDSFFGGGLTDQLPEDVDDFVITA